MKAIPGTFRHQGLRPPRWLVLETQPVHRLVGGGEGLSGRVHAMLSNSIGDQLAQRIAEDIASRIGRKVVLVKEHHGGRKKNPTLVHHGLAQGAAWHVLSETGRALADLYGFNQAQARRVGTLLANLIGQPVRILDNATQPADLRAHPRTYVSNPPRRRRNPLGPGESLSEAEQYMLHALYPNAMLDNIARKSSREFDLVVSGFYVRADRASYHKKGDKFSAWIPLARIATENWTAPKIADQTDYPDMARSGDWSGVRDSDEATIWRIFEGLRKRRNPGGFVFGQAVPRSGLMARIRPGDRVTIVDRFGKQRTGRAVMPSSHGGWVLNMGGAHGTPGLADENNTVKVVPSKRNPSRSKGARARRRGGLKSRTSSKVWKAAVRAVRRRPFPGNAAQSLHYLQSHRARKARRTKNPKRPTTVREAVAQVIESARFPVVAKEVRSGKHDPVKSLEFVRRFMGTERERAIIDQALRLVRKFPGRLLDSPARPNPREGTNRDFALRPKPLPRSIDTRSVRTVRRGRTRKNPSSEMQRARRTYRMWSEMEPGKVTRVKAPTRIPKVMAKLGELVSVVYRSDKWDGKPKLYEHKTRRPRPVLAADPDGRHVHIVGGNMKITADGLVN